MSKRTISFRDKSGRLLLLVCAGVILIVIWSMYLSTNLRYMRVKYMFSNPGPLIQARIPTLPASIYKKTPTSSFPKPDPMIFITYVSKRLGITFSYLDSTRTQKFLVKEEINKIYLYWDKSDYRKGYSVEVFTKDPQDDLAQALRNNFLLGYSSDTCTVSKNIKYFRKGIYPQYQTAVITVPFNPAQENRNKLVDLLKKCPAEYTYDYNGVAYFIYNPQVADKFVFVSIGQDNLLGSADHTWDETLEITSSATTP